MNYLVRFDMNNLKEYLFDWEAGDLGGSWHLGTSVSP